MRQWWTRSGRIALLWFCIFVCFIFVEFNIKWLMTSHRMYSFLVVFLYFCTVVSFCVFVLLYFFVFFVFLCFCVFVFLCFCILCIFIFVEFNEVADDLSLSWTWQCNLSADFSQNVLFSCCVFVFLYCCIFLCFCASVFFCVFCVFVFLCFCISMFLYFVYFYICGV